MTDTELLTSILESSQRIEALLAALLLKEPDPRFRRVRGELDETGTLSNILNGATAEQLLEDAKNKRIGHPNRP